MYLLELDDIMPDVVLAAAVDLELDIMDFCISQLEVKETVMDDMCVEEDKFLVSLHHFTELKALTYQFWMWPQNHDDETSDEEEDTVNDENSTEQSSGNIDQSPGVQYLLIDDEDHGMPVQSQKDIIKIMSRCLKKAKKITICMYHENHDSTHHNCRLCQALCMLFGKQLHKKALHECKSCYSSVHG